VRRLSLPHWLAIAAHFGLAAAVSLTVGTLDLGLRYHLLIAVLALLPLAMSLSGLVRRRRASLQWLAVALVLYVGFGTVEAIAGGHPAAIAMLLLALLELALVLGLTRAQPPQAPRGSMES
jgi:hypothetical protein